MQQMSINIHRELAMDPTKKPQCRVVSNDYVPASTLDTLRSDINSNQHKEQYDVSQDFDLARIYNLQSENLQYSIQKNIIQGGISYFMSSLRDTNMHLYSLSPVPNIQDIPIQDFLDSCFQNSIPVSRAAWAVHIYVKRNQTTQCELTDRFKSLLNSKPNPRDIPHCVEFAYELYSKNLIKHEEILLDLMTRHPASRMERFSHEIIPTHSILIQFLTSSEDKHSYLKSLFKNRTPITESQLVQLALNHQTSDFIENLHTKNTKLRIKILSGALSECKLSSSTHYRNLIFQTFPIIDSYVLCKKLQDYIKYDTVKERQKLAMYLIQSINWFHSYEEAIASTVAYLIKRVTPNFDYNAFFDFLFDDYENSYKYRHLFFELQVQELFGYSYFLKYIKNKLYTHKEQCLSLLSNLPCAFIEMTMQKYIFYDILNKMSTLTNHDFSEQINRIQNDLFNNIDELSEMPFVLRFYLVFRLINQKNNNFDKVCSLMKKIGSLSLITRLFFQSQPEKLSVYAVYFIEQTLSLFVSHDLLKQLIQVSTNPPSPNSAISELIYQHLRENKDEKYSEILKEYQGQLHQDPSKNPNINKENLRDLIYKNSYLFSVSVYDMFLSVQNFSDFEKVFLLFFNDLLSFSGLTHSLLLNFYIEFCESHCIQSGSTSQLFIDLFLATVQINSNTTLVNENSNSYNVIMSFLTYLFQSGLISPSSYLKRVFTKPRGASKTEKKVNMPLMDLFFKIIDENETLFSTSAILTENVIKDFNEKDKELFVELLTRLKRCPPPIITNRLLPKFANDSSSPFAAAYFSLLPDELLQDDVHKVFDYFVFNVSRTTSTFWTLWLRQMINYNPVFPVSPKNFDQKSTENHIQNLTDLFSNALLTNDQISPEKIEILLNCWNLLCFDERVSDMLSIKTAQLIENYQLLFTPIQFDYLHPIFNSASYQNLEQICTNFCQKHLSHQLIIGDSTERSQLTNEDYIFIKLASLSFITFAKKYFSSLNSIEFAKKMVDKLFDFMNSMYKDENCQTDFFVIDSFNYIVTKTSDFPKNTNNLTDFHQYLFKSFDKVYPDIRCHLIVNMLMQQFKSVPDPLFIDLMPDNELIPENPIIDTNFEPINNNDFENTTDIFSDFNFDYPFM